MPLNRSDAEAFAHWKIDEKTVKEAKKKDDKLDEKVRNFMCQNFFDIRAFGAVMTTLQSLAVPRPGSSSTPSPPSKKDGVISPRAYSDYTVTVNEPALPSGVTCTRLG